MGRRNIRKLIDLRKSIYYALLLAYFYLGRLLYFHDETDMKMRDEICTSPHALKSNYTSPFIRHCDVQQQPGGCSFFGTAYGGFEVPSSMCFLPKGGTMISVGCGEDISFDVAIAAKYGILVHLFDPTPRAKIHVESVLQALETKTAPALSANGKSDHYVAIDGTEREISGKVDAREWFQNIVDSTAERKQFTYNAWALGAQDGVMTFVAPKSGVSHFLSNNKNHSETSIEVPVKSLQSMMTEINVDTVDLLKIDIEGAEPSVIPELIKLFHTWPRSRWPKVMFVDMDSLLKAHPNQNVQGGRNAVQALIDAGYEVFAGPSVSKAPFSNADFVFVLKSF